MSEFEHTQSEFDQSPVITFHKKCMLLKIFIDSEDEELISKYKEAIEKHNLESEEIHYNSGFDLFLPDTIHIDGDWFMQTKMVDHKVKCEAFMCESATNQNAGNKTDNANDNDNSGWELVPTGFYLYPRSSLSKLPLMMSNHVGIIDSGYRGNLIAAVRNLGVNELIMDVPKYSRLFQICAPTLCPIHVILVDKDDLSNTVRGDGGFGSSGK